ncbi:hypothetical protein HK22_02160 [Gluconobacter sp. DsW_056]|uniref:hypothetical protein n=1 Tax=Gluconobacter sp. DsW_056 TaxID=1511209 RepID=UPI000A3755E0|nr:hypothetical protein [Gluconobacter sp. DsW_056]OUI81682.1 hypothetical protein HK22_02160 [Gluconobacter sp. DsW_056]
MALMQSYAEMATQYIEGVIGELLVSAPVKWTIARTPNENFNHYFKALMMPTMSFGGNSFLTGQWINLPGRATSLDSMVMSRPAQADQTLVENVDYFTDLNSKPARFQLSWNQDIYDEMALFSSITVNFTGGIADSPETVPMDIQMGIIEIVKNMMYSGGSMTMDIDSPMVQSIIRNHQRVSFGSRW